MNDPAPTISYPSPAERYQFKPFIGSSHHWAIAHCLGLPASSRVLDIGAGPGVIGAVLLQNGFRQLSAVEIDAQARTQAQSIYQRVAPNIDPFQNEKFDLILLLDILEHLSNPFEFFGKVASMLDRQGTILVSVPNIAHWSVRLPLLFGLFEYANRGILDRTHLQFFTRRRFKQLLSSLPELAVFDMSASIEPAEFVLPRFVWNNAAYRGVARMRSALAHHLPGFFAYQHLAALRKM